VFLRELRGKGFACTVRTPSWRTLPGGTRELGLTTNTTPLGVLFGRNLSVSGQPISRILSSAEAPGRPSLYAVYPGLNEASSLSSLFDLAPGGGYQAARITADAGGLLHHLFIMTTSPPAPLLKGEGSKGEGLFVFCGPIRQITPPRGFPGAALYGVRTFLDPAPKARDRDRPTDLRRIHHTFPASRRQFPYKTDTLSPLTFYAPAAKMIFCGGFHLPFDRELAQ